MAKTIGHTLWRLRYRVSAMVFIIAATVTLVMAQQPAQAPPRDAIAEAQQTSPAPATRPEQVKNDHDRSDVFDAPHAQPSSSALDTQPKDGKNTGFDFFKDPLGADKPSEDTDAIMKQLIAAKPAVMQAHRAMLEQRYILEPTLDQAVKMSRGKPLPVGPTARLHSGMTWERLAQMPAADIRHQGVFPYPALPHQLQTNGGMVFPSRLLNGLCHLLIENGTVDRDFIANHTVRFEPFRRIVSRYTPDRVEEICGVPAAQLRTAAEWIGRSQTTVTTCLQGVYQSNQATAAACAVNSMHLLMGKVGRPGCAPMQFAGQPSSMNTRETGADGTYPAYLNWEDKQHMPELAKRWAVPVELLGKQPVGAPEIPRRTGQGG